MKGEELRTWKCKYCGAENEISEVLADPIRRQVAEELRPQLADQEAGKVANQLADLRDNVQLLQGENRELKDNETELRRQRRALEKAKADQDLLVERAVDEVRERIAEEESKRASEHYEIRIQEQNEKIARLTRDLDATQQRLHQSPSELRGTVQEKTLQETVKELCPDDLITRFGKGRRGADVRWLIRDKGGSVVGTPVLLERKQAREWDNAWLPKLREDMRTESAAFGVLVSIVVPDGRASVSDDGVFIVQPDGVPFVTELIRQHVLALAQARSIAELGDDPKDRLWDYATTGKLWQRLGGIAEPIVARWNAIQTDREADERRRSRDEEFLRREVKHVAGLCGDFQAMGAELPEVPLLELPSAG